MTKDSIQTFELTGAWQEIGCEPFVTNDSALANAWGASMNKARNEALEEAAKISEYHATAHSYHASPVFIGETIATAIRNLKTKGE